MDTKICSKCNRNLPITHYHKNGFDKNGNQKYRGYCKDCANTLEKARYRKKKQFVEQNKSVCQKCGENRVYVLDFHHIDKTEKDFTIGKMGKGNLDLIKKEIDKCVVLCANCHREFHYLEKEKDLSLEDYLTLYDEGRYTIEKVR